MSGDVGVPGLWNDGGRSASGNAFDLLRTPMNEELVTAAEFGDHTQAVVARMHLEEAGIPAFLSDEWMSQGLFELGSAAGGVRIQVPASRVEEAVRLINDRLPEHAAAVNWSEVDVGQPEMMGSIDDEGTAAEPSAETSSPAEPVTEIEPADLTLRERRANRIILGALIGVFCLPVYFLAVWRLIQIANSTERLRPEYERKANIGALIIGVTFPFVLPFCFCFAASYFVHP
jgi:Putative prokaryotic signal transducing protein